MKRVLLTGINGTVAQVMKKELGTKYDISGLSIPRMDGLLAEGRSLGRSCSMPIAIASARS